MYHGGKKRKGERPRPQLVKTRPEKRRSEDPMSAAVDHTGASPENTSDTSGIGGHPRGLPTLFLTEMWERFSYYGLRPLLVLFMSAALQKGGFGFERGEAS